MNNSIYAKESGMMFIITTHEDDLLLLATVNVKLTN